MATDDKTQALGSAPVGTLFFRLAIPAVLGQIAVLLNNVIDRVWVGHVPGDGMVSLGAVGLSLPIHHVFLSVILMLAVGMCTEVSILLGRGDRAQARRVSGSCFGLATVFSVFSTLIIVLFADDLLRLFGAGDASLPFARSYLSTLAWGIPFSNALLMLTMWFNSQGHVSTGVRLNLLNVLVNLALDPVFIFPCGMGVTGAALATNLGAVVALSFGLWIVRRNTAVLQPGAAEFIPRFGLFARPVALGSSTLLNVALESLTLMILNGSMQRYGGDLAVATLSLFGVPLLILMNLCLGLSHGAQPIVSYNYGGGRIDRVEEANRWFVLVSFAASSVLWAVALTAPRLLWRCFTSDAVLADFAAGKTRLFFAVMLFGGIQYAHIYIIKFLGRVRMSLFLGALKRLFLLLPLIFVLPAMWSGDKVSAVLLASPASDFVAFVVTAFCYLKVMRGMSAKEAR